GTTVEHVQNKSLTWRHLRSVLDRHRITLNGHIVFAMNKFEHISISRFQKLKTVCNRVLGTHNFYSVSTPRTDFLIRSISFTGHTVFTNEPTFGETFTRISGGVCRKSSRGVRVELPTGCSDRRTCLNSINASSHYSESFLRSRYFFGFTPISAKAQIHDGEIAWCARSFVRHKCGTLRRA